MRHETLTAFRADVLPKLCKLRRDVMVRTEYLCAADCICPDAPADAPYYIDEVTDWIIETVQAALARGERPANALKWEG